MVSPSVDDPEDERNPQQPDDLSDAAVLTLELVQSLLVRSQTPRRRQGGTGFRFGRQPFSIQSACVLLLCPDLTFDHWAVGVKLGLLGSGLAGVVLAVDVAA